MNHIDLPELQRDILDLIARSPHWSPKQAELAADFGALLDVVRTLLAIEHDDGRSDDELQEAVIAALAPFRAKEQPK